MNASVETKIQWAFKKFSLKNDDFFFFFLNYLYMCVLIDLSPKQSRLDNPELFACVCTSSLLHVYEFYVIN